MTTPLRGVNLGGWLILEKWMTPTLFKGTKARDEYTFMREPDAEAKIDHHRQTFITEDDFAWLQNNGITAVRIPVGYWLFDAIDGYQPTVQYLDWAVEMASKYQLKVLIDMHGGRGSQNGHDHSGRVGKSEWFARADYREQTIELLERIARRYYDQPCIWGIQLLNEPKWGLFHWKLRRYYRRAYQRLVAVARPGTTIVFHDGFTPRLLSGAVKAVPDYPVVMDVHWYQFASIWRRWHRLDWYFAKLGRRHKLVDRLQRRQPIIVGEWSIVLSGRILRGRTKAEQMAAFKRHGQLQLASYEKAAGWFYWNYKTEARGIWHFRSQIEDGIISLD